MPLVVSDESPTTVISQRPNFLPVRDLADEMAVTLGRR
jgi:hypothetical protein